MRERHSHHGIADTNLNKKRFSGDGTWPSRDDVQKRWYPRETFGIDFYTFIKISFISPVLDVSTCNWIENKFRHVLTRVPRYSSVPAQLSTVAPDVVVAKPQRLENYWKSLSIRILK